MLGTLVMCTVAYPWNLNIDIKKCGCNSARFYEMEKKVTQKIILRTV
jgi:hypothetical protein